MKQSTQTSGKQVSPSQTATTTNVNLKHLLHEFYLVNLQKHLKISHKIILSSVTSLSYVLDLRYRMSYITIIYDYHK